MDIVKRQRILLGDNLLVDQTRVGIQVGFHSKDDYLVPKSLNSAMTT